MTTTENVGGTPEILTIVDVFPGVDDTDVESAQREELFIRSTRVGRQLADLGIVGSYISQYHSLPMADYWLHVVIRPFRGRPSLPHITVCEVYHERGMSYDYVANPTDAAFSRVTTFWDGIPTVADFSDQQRGGYIWTKMEEDGLLMAYCRSGRGFTMPEPDVSDFRSKSQSLFPRRGNAKAPDTVLLRIMRQVEIAGELSRYLGMLSEVSYEKGIDIQLQ